MTSSHFDNAIPLVRKNKTTRWSRRAGFTLIEILITLSIIGVIASLIGPRILNYLSDSKIKAAHIQMENISSALDLFYLDAGRYPTTDEGLSALITAPAKKLSSWSGPYLKASSAIKDPWGHTYIYRAPGKTSPYDISSTGPETKDGAKAITRSTE